MKTGTITIRCGNRSISEIVDLAEHESHFSDEDYGFPEGVTFETSTRDIDTDDIESVNGHFMYGYFECLFQSDVSPWSFLTLMGEEVGLTFSFRRNDVQTD